MKQAWGGDIETVKIVFGRVLDLCSVLVSLGVGLGMLYNTIGVAALLPIIAAPCLSLLDLGALVGLFRCGWLV